ncbi:hypothetical protein MNV49_002918 [Pseudohyphozyma bogoriensis]|nr:hypothetical protein MNV49_002918 [Pseudohyphozyma bogoriensis]
MPATTVKRTVHVVKPYTRTTVAPKRVAKDRTADASRPANTDGSRANSSKAAPKLKDEVVLQGVPFPTGLIERARFRMNSGKPVSAHQWKVYDYITTNLPAGQVTTYGILAEALGSSAQAIGGALRDNPFFPFVPCHRVIATTRYIGGYQGEWNATTEPTKRRGRKLELLKEEGVQFDEEGYLPMEVELWRPPKGVVKK